MTLLVNYVNNRFLTIRIAIRIIKAGISLKRRALIKQLALRGFWYHRSGGNHDIYTNGTVNIPVPRSSEINEFTAKGILRSAEAKERK